MLGDLQSIFWERRNSFEIDWMNVDARFTRDYGRKIHRLAIDQNQIDFGMRDSAGLDHVLDRRSFGQLAVNPRRSRF